jgi:hypothetical protein
MKDLTAKEIAVRYGVEKRVAQGWIQRGLFPHARKDQNPIFGEVWLVPEADLKNFAPPRAGRPSRIKKDIKAA